MARRKTNETDDSADEFIDSIENESKREDCRAIRQLKASRAGCADRKARPAALQRPLPGV